jgi:tetratricopeptide (TPR) repeat protein
MAMNFARHTAKVAWFLALNLALATQAYAEAPSSEATVEARRQQAKLKFAQGSEKFENGEYQAAVVAFMEADRLAPSAALSFNVARAYERLNDPSGALRWYRDYLRRNPRAKNAREVKARIAELSAALSQSGMQQLSVLSMPSGALVVVDGRAVGTTPFTCDLPLGKHRIQLDLSGYRDQGSTLVLKPSGPTDLNVELVPQPSTPAPSSPIFMSSQRQPERDGGRRFGIAPWLVAGGGVASLGGALGFELARRANEDAARNAANQLEFKAKSDAMSRDQTTARVLGGVGGALLLTGTIMLITNDREPSAPRVGLGCTFRGCTASARGSF